MKKIKLMSVLGALLVAAAVVVGCGGQKNGEVWPAKWDADATAYFNQNVPPLKNLPGKVYHYQVTKVADDVYVNALYIDGKFIENLKPNAAQKIGGVAAGQLDGVHIVYSAGDGYKVATRYEFGRTIHQALANNFPVFFKNYL
ncbi:hypothetical protein C1X35_19165 [Pseudomonas sp. FW306-1C-G01A]|uniref:hypothetical protein n=1 Tax=unclassified Pseudomonas TaxID=196821 RepID=UPI000C86D9E5|nr:MULTISPECIES: hypothetical protein [unclassified Pseudomonas]PMV86721.1 hypothetical protein C1X56_13815 [Pseudomonas sp. GW101-1A09]PMV94478.1 hypothetical protein C1X51_12465 [Pseudomonas sp. FW306-2-2C-B10A]PMW04376.1 hypothetical protein C1X50_18130 [Pseudomonas sp. MPR-TSA4]PMW11441.1 hypothetical protein C1X52_21075 [Pseudomonas sp. FW306-2-1A-C05A]PMW33334.1 hypothetical protein C1X48_22685 [Pseudomonas sp. FW305-3-2-15-A-R2A1]